jgi:pimeloyl-ACP methyl ester carboxylesterase
MLKVREYGNPANPPVILLHGGPGAAGHMAPAARGLVDAFRIYEPFQRKSAGEPLTVARHVADLHDVIAQYTPDRRPVLLGASWGAMLALAYAAAHPDAPGPLILVGCGTFDASTRAAFEKTVAERTTDEIHAQFEAAGRLGGDEGLRAKAKALTPIYAYDAIDLPYENAEFDAKGHRETWDDMLRLQAEGAYPAAFAAIKAPVLLLHGSFDPHPGRLTARVLQPHVPQLEYHELEQCGHDPWAERAAAGAFFSFVRNWLARHPT